MEDEGSSFDDIYKAFRLPLPVPTGSEPSKSPSPAKGIHLSHASTVHALVASEWDALFGGQGFDSHGLALLEQSFRDNRSDESNWGFDYIVARDQQEQPVVAGFFTYARWKDDMLAPAAVSVLIERQRANDPHFLTSRVLSSGSLITEGPHLFIARDNPLWKDALSQVIKKVSTLHTDSGVDTLVFRDFYGDDPELDRVFLDNGFFSSPCPKPMFLDLEGVSSAAELHDTLSPNAKKNVRKEVREHQDKFTLEFVSTASDAELRHWYELYLNVKRKNLGLNTFDLPFRMFETIVADERWDKMVLRLRPEFDHLHTGAPVCFAFSYRSASTYVPTIIGLDYRYNSEYRIYKQALYRTVLRAIELGCKKVLLGFAASTDKRKFGARAMSTHGYMQGRDGFNFDVLQALELSAGTELRSSLVQQATAGSPGSPEIRAAIEDVRR